MPSPGFTPETLHLLGVHPVRVAFGSVAHPASTASMAAHLQLHHELADLVQRESGTRLSSENRNWLRNFYRDVLSWSRTRLTRENFRREVTDARARLKDQFPKLKESAKGSAVQVAANYGLILALNALLHKHGIDPGRMGLTEFNAQMVHHGLTMGVFLMEYAAAKRQLERGIVPSSAQVAVPIAGVLDGKRGLKNWTAVSAFLDVAKTMAPGGGGGNPVWKNLPGLGVRFVLALLNYSFPGTTHRVVRRIDLLAARLKRGPTPS